jgi:glyoxylase-like metal-dependent hydrolase (beta-lactamase superfamily II)/predicted DCC family thiol-disulfide oxidoreductase YuxK
MEARGALLTAVYDGQCEICQAAVSWIRALDRRGAVRCVAIQDGPLADVHPALARAECFAQLHVVDADGRIDVGWRAVARIAGAIPLARPLAALDRLAMTRAAADRAYRYVARNRHQLSTCRGGACMSFEPATSRRRADAGPFWACYSLGLLLRLPLVAGVGVADQVRYARDYARTFRRRVVLLDDVLELWFLGGFPADIVPLAFGERFTAIWYGGVLIDPGSVRMRPSLAVHLDAAAERGQVVTAVTATHRHEEHVGNLEWAARRSGVPVVLAQQVAGRLQPAAPIPPVRAAVIGQPPSLRGPVADADGGIAFRGGRLEVLPAPGHSSDHVVLWDPDERVLLAGDAFMGAYFSSPNDDVDSHAWMSTLQRLLDLDVSVMVEGHGHVHTLRQDVPAIPGVVQRTDPRRAIERKLEFLTWLDTRIAEARADGRTNNAAVAACFPWGRRWSWERLAADEIARIATIGEFSRHQLIRSFHRAPDELLPTLFEARIPRSPARRAHAHADPGTPHGYGRRSQLSAWWRRAKIAAWTRSCRPSLVRMLRTWVLTVCSPIARFRAICRLP